MSPSALPPPGTPDQLALVNSLALAVLSIPEERRANAIERAVWAYHESLGKAFPEYSEDLRLQSTFNFICALRRRFQLLHLTSGGVVGRA